MNSIQELLVLIISLVSWSNSGGDIRAGLPAQSSTLLVNQSLQIKPLIEQSQRDLLDLKDKWHAILAVQESRSEKALGQSLLDQLKDTDQSLSRVIQSSGGFSSALSSFDHLIKQQKKHSDNEMAKAKTAYEKAKSDEARFNRKKAEATNSGDKMLAAQSVFQALQASMDASYAISNQQHINDVLTENIRMIENLSTLKQLIIDYQNRTATLQGSLIDAIRNEQKVINTTSETLSAYYNKRLGKSMSELLANI